jgi:hypothetical protein
MPYILRYKYDRNQPQKVRGLPFATVPLAIASGRTLLAAGAGWDFEVLDDKGDVVASESDIRRRSDLRP